MISMLDVPHRRELEQLTEQVRRNNRTLPEGGVEEGERRTCDSHARRSPLADQARLLHHQGESHLRSGVRRHAARQRRSLARAVRPRRHTEPPRAGRAVRAAGQLLRSRRPVGAGASVGSAGVSEHVGAQIRERPQRPEPDAARTDRCHLRQRQGARADGSLVRRAGAEHDHAGQRDVDRLSTTTGRTARRT